MAELKNSISSVVATTVASTAKVTSTITESTNLNGTVEVEKDGMKQTVLTMSCNLTQNTVTNVQTYPTTPDNMKLFFDNQEAANAEVEKFRKIAKEKGKDLNCFVF
ncbi:hypothetical protein ACQZHJ_18530 (plasmid) [Clostridium sp. B9]